MARSAYARRYTLVGIILAAVILIGAVVSGWWYLQRATNNPLSEDAVLTANRVNVAATIAGRVVTIAVTDNQRVTEGDLLFALDPEPYQLAVAQVRADLRLAEASPTTRDAQRRTISAEQSNAAVATEQVQRARSNLALAEATLARLLPLASKG